jgi:hypothetical protein
VDEGRSAGLNEGVLNEGGYSPRMPRLGKTVLSTEKSSQVPTIGSGNWKHDQDADRFKYSSMPKEVVKKMTHVETKEVPFYSQRSTFDPKALVSSKDPQQKVYSFSGGAKNRFKYDSLPKETIKKNFGTETRHLGFVPQGSTLSKSCNTMFGSKGSQPGATRDRFQRVSLEKEITKGAEFYGVESRNVAYAPQSLHSSVKMDRGVSFGNSSKLQGPKDGNVIVHNFEWGQRLKREQTALDKLEAGLQKQGGMFASTDNIGCLPGERTTRPSTSLYTGRIQTTPIKTQSQPVLPTVRLDLAPRGVAFETGHRSARRPVSARFEARSRQSSRPLASSFNQTLGVLEMKLERVKTARSGRPMTSRQKAAVDALQQLCETVQTKRAQYL